MHYAFDPTLLPDAVSELASKDFEVRRMLPSRPPLRLDRARSAHWPTRTTRAATSNCSRS
jgi:hypothetical protein